MSRLPVAAILLAPAASRVLITYLGVLVALGITGALGAACCTASG